MPAYAALVSLEQVITHTLSYVLQDYVSIQIRNSSDYIVLIHLCKKDEMKSLNDDVIFLQERLEEFPKKCVSLESRIRDVSYLLEDIIESFLSGTSCTSFASDGSNGRKLYWSDMKSEFSNCRRDLHSTVEEAAKMERNLEHDEDVQVAGSSSATTSLNGYDKCRGKVTMVGFAEDLRKILERATGHDKALQFIPIVGMGGIGKTTLARNVYDHSLIVEHFHIRSWVTVSQEYRLLDILQGLLSAKSESQEDDEALILRLYQHLKGRKFLVVLDDMWDAEVWDKIMRAFPEDNNGSRIIITTRLSQVATEIDSSEDIHQMKLLTEDESWSMMCEKVFEKDSCCPSQLKQLGKRISSNCKGLPLAINVIAGLLKSSNTQDYWEETARNVSETAASDDQLDKILSLSYDNLPHSMKACFLYTGVFPEDYKITPNFIIELCVAEGFVKAKGGKSTELVAKECFEDLVRRNLVMQEAPWDGYSKVFRVHDILRELCIKKAEEEYFFLHYNSGKFTKEMNFSETANGHRRIIFEDGIESYLLPNHRYNLSLRSSVSVGVHDFYENHPPLLFSTQFMLLRILHKLSLGVEYYYLMTSDDSILFKLIHLRYLSIHSGRGPNFLRAQPDNDMHISSSLVQLEHLQLLEFGYLFVAQGGTVHLPWNIWGMAELRHLKSSCVNIQFSNSHYCSGTLEFLQTLSDVRDFKFTNEAIERFPNLKTLTLIYGVRCNADWAEYRLDNLVHLHQLEELNVTGGHYFGVPLPTNLTFPENIKRLHLFGFEIQGEIMSKMSKLLSLEVLILVNCSFKGELFEGEFPQLKYLEMEYPQIEEWNIEEINFPCLEHLFLKGCYNIGVGDDIATLEKLRLLLCHGKTVESAKRIQDEQLRNGNSTFQMISYF